MPLILLRLAAAAGFAWFVGDSLDKSNRLVRSTSRLTVNLLPLALLGGIVYYSMMSKK